MYVSYLLWVPRGRPEPDSARSDMAVAQAMIALRTRSWRRSQSGAEGNDVFVAEDWLECDMPSRWPMHSRPGGHRCSAHDHVAKRKGGAL